MKRSEMVHIMRDIIISGINNDLSSYDIAEIILKEQENHGMLPPQVIEKRTGKLLIGMDCFGDCEYVDETREYIVTKWEPEDL